MTTNVQDDPWAKWLLLRRHGGSEEQMRLVMEKLEPVRRQVLEHAEIREGNTVLDVGSGDGLISFGALKRVGDQGQVIFSDISRELLDHCKGLAEQMGAAARCRFVEAAATDLSAFPDASVDAVTTRSVLCYVKDKLQAFREDFRVLKPGGRLSVFEPINRFGYPGPPHMFSGYDATPIITLVQKIRAVYRKHIPMDSDTMLDYDERDLLTLVEKAGFRECHLQFVVDVEPARPQGGWPELLKTAVNPLAPTLGEALEEGLTPEERKRFEDHLRPLVEAGAGTNRTAVAYVWGRKV
ncbi:MAG: class I SAM-dependent methyltransferase [Candidatus Xenobia bacterium]